MRKALIIVDVQNDFCKGGALAVKNAKDIIDPINDLILTQDYDLIIATKDWHPQNHSSFKSNNPETGIWPNHCIQNTKGSEFHPKLSTDKINHIIFKGTNPEVDSYSGFFDNDRQSETGLNQLLLASEVSEVDIVGLALDYCVKATALDSVRLGYKTSVIVNLTRAVNINPYDGKNSLAELTKNKVELK